MEHFLPIWKQVHQKGTIRENFGSSKDFYMSIPIAIRIVISLKLWNS